MARRCLSRSNNSLESGSSIQYKDRLYKSASQALEDYIKDYDLSLASPDIKPGKICINQSTPRDLKPPKDRFQQKCALEDFEQRAIKVPISPPSRRKTTRDPDMLSLTTDDLLAFPPDGSVSFNQVTALRPERQNSKSKRKSQTSASCVHHQTSSFGSEGEMSFPGDPVISSSYKDFSRKVSTKHTFHRYRSDASGRPLQNRLTEQEESEPVFHKNYPRWLTSQKSDLSVSEISSLPDFKYPAWLDSHNLLPDSATESFSQTSEGGSDFSHLQGSQKRTSVQNLSGSNDFRHPEWNGLVDLQNKDTVVRNCHHDCRRVCFAPDGLGEDQHSWRENDPKAPLKVKRTPESSADELASALNNGGSPCTVDNLEAERSWDNVPVGLKSPVPVCCEDNSPPSSKASIVNGFLEDCLQNSSQESTFSGGNHHGPVEALKLMLFNLQAFQRSFDLKKTAEQNEESEKASHEDVDLRQCDNDIIPVTRSLQRALHHLSRLKGLVEDTCGKEELKRS
ncbi:lung adenoma susceptibility protein 2 [Sphaerodactylus townsendi]|uniref:lung adenoma susceptibility protein 2 n=1 Tax=Sphaerodactylus townsendi TaxID=933632 RepID=UPI002026D9B3|nr:lung adenoma susceptibility protein 2 [Sphaerodactylus townsendi]